jgi:hypothetical protein
MSISQNLIFEVIVAKPTPNVGAFDYQVYLKLVVHNRVKVDKSRGGKEILLEMKEKICIGDCIGDSIAPF